MISIITPTYNSAQYLENCICSIKGQNAEFEHIVVDGGSADGTISILKKYEGTYNLRWISEKDEGMYDALAKGFSMAKGDIFCWLNSDDQYLPWTLEIIESVFLNKKINWCQGIPSYINSSGLQYMLRDNRFTAEKSFIKSGLHDGQRLGCLQQESMFWRKSLYEKSGGLNTSLKYASDYFLWKAFARYEELYSINAVLACFRIHEKQKSADRKAYLGEIGEINSFQKMLNNIKYYKLLRYIEALKAHKNRIDVRNIRGIYHD